MYFLNLGVKGLIDYAQNSMTGNLSPYIYRYIVPGTVFIKYQ